MELERRLRDALDRLNPDLPEVALDDAVRRRTRPEDSTLEARTRAFHRMLVDGVTVEYRASDGAIRGAQAGVIDFEDPTANDWLAVNQFTLAENRNTRRPDMVLFLNGLPLGLIELKNPSDADATIWTAWRQLQTYQAELPSLFSMNELLSVSDGTQARVSALTAGQEWFKPWRTITGESFSDASLTKLQVLLEGVCQPERFLSLLGDFIVFDDDGSGKLVKKLAGYHQFHAVRTAVDETLRAAELQREGVIAPGPLRGRYETGGRPGGEVGNRRIGVVWHTQGSGKSLTMSFYAGAIIREPAMHNPTIVVLTDHVDLYNELVRLRPGWHDGDDAKGNIKVVMTGSASDPPQWQQHVRNKARREALAQRFRDPGDAFRIVLVRDMWLTGFDAPGLHTMYLDKPMRGHGLTQAIARVNRVFRDELGGLVMDYLGLANDLRQALAPIPKAAAPSVPPATRKRRWR